jgi:hypothetical protein
MTETLFNFEAASPEELKKYLSALPKKKPGSLRLAKLAISGPQVLVRPFQFDAITPKELTTRLLHEAVSLLSLPVSQVALTYQTFASSDGKVNGVYLCLPRKILHGYLWVLHRAQFVPTHITASSALYLDHFLKEVQTEGKVCFINFSNPKAVVLTVILQKKCELLREIPYEDWADTKAEIIQSLRSVCAKSSMKQFERLYIIGSDPHQAELAQQIQQGFNVTAESRPAVNVMKILEETDIVSLNWARSYVFSVSERQQILKIFHIIIALLLFISIGFGVKVALNGRAINKVKSSYTSAEYQHAVDLRSVLEKKK